MADEKVTVQCECGYNGPLSKFCPQCGKIFETAQKEYICECGAVVTGKFCTNCGKPGPANENFVPNRELSQDEKQRLAEHGWRDENGTLKMILRNGRFAAQYCPGASNEGSDGSGEALQDTEEYQLDTSYSFMDIGYGSMGMMFAGAMGLLSGGSANGNPGGTHPNEVFRINLRNNDLRKPEPVAPYAYRIMKLWYGAGTLHADLYSFKDNRGYTVDLLQDDNLEISFVEKETPVGLTCPKCGSEFQNGDICEKCGEKLNWVVLFAGSTYSTCNPPTSSGFRVYACTDEKLILDYYSNEASYRRFISAQVLDEAYRIIKEYHIDEWEQYKDRMSGIMGGTVTVSYRDGDRLVGTSMDQMGFQVQGAHSALQTLFFKNILK